MLLFHGLIKTTPLPKGFGNVECFIRASHGDHNSIIQLGTLRTRISPNFML